MNWSRYTKEDLKILIELFKWEIDPLDNISVTHIPDENGTWKIKVVNLEKVLWDDTLEFPCKFTVTMRNFLYKIPYEDVPTYIGDSFYATFATWRIKIGK